MKKRAKEILDFIIENRNVSADELIYKFKISRRTLYYDINLINYDIKNFGEIKNINHNFTFIGDYSKLNYEFFNKENKFLNSEYRKKYILYKILNCEKVTINELTKLMLLSRNTIVQSINEIKSDLKKTNLKLIYNKKYTILGNEYKIRELFILLMQEDKYLLETVSEEVLLFDKKCNIGLTDYSLANLSKFINFLNTRIHNGSKVSSYKFKYDVIKFKHYYETKKLLNNIENEDEVAYLAAYISTLPSLNKNVEEKLIKDYVNKLIYKFEVNTAIVLESKEEFKKNIKRHLLTSYYRIKFGFPISNQSLIEIKVKYESLYKIIKSIIENEDDFPDFIGIREEEIGFIAAYFGVYLKGSRDSGVRKNRVLVVCPNGLMISKILEVQLYKYIPTIDIIGVISIKELKKSNIYYDYIISTVEIPATENVIVVNPLLTKLDIQILMSKLINFDENDIKFNLELILQAVKKNAQIIDEEKLKEDLLKIICTIEEKETYQPMLKELINEKRINKIKYVADWEEAIKIASKPLLKDNSIEQLYVDEMIQSIHKYGPYIVLADKFALPHAKAKKGVNKLAMSLLIVEDPVDLLGKPVNIFMVLATIDNVSHIKALASLSELLYEEENINKIINGSEKEILELMNNQK